MSLPSGYKELEYIQSSGTQYINTGCTLTIGNKFDFKCQFIDSSFGNDVLFGANSNAYEVAIGLSNHITHYLGGKFTYALNLSTDYIFSLDLALTTSNLQLIVDGVSVRDVRGNVNNKNVYLFGAIAGSSSTTIDKMHSQIFYYFKAYNSTGLYLNLVPCKQLSDNAIGMYDTVSNTFFGNSGTGSFIAGPEVITQSEVEICKTYVGVPNPDYVELPSGYTQVEYIESSGSQYIQLNFGFDNTDEVDFKFSEKLSELRDKYMVAPSTWNSNNNRFGMGRHNSRYTVGYGGLATEQTYLLPYTDYNDDLPHIWHYKNLQFTIDNPALSINVSSITWGGTTTNLKLFYGLSSNTKGAIYYYHHKKANAEYFLVPCKNSSNEYGMYDTVNNQFYTNAGTGSFTGGDVVGPAKEVEVNKQYVVVKTENLFDVDETAVGSIAELQAITKPTKSRANVTTAGTIGNNMMWTANAKGIVIPCSKGDTFTLKIFGTITTSRKYYNECDADGKNLTTRSAYSDSYEKTITTTQDNCAYLFIEWSIDTEDNAEVVVVEGSTAPTEYLPYWQLNETNKSYIIKED